MQTPWGKVFINQELVKYFSENVSDLFKETNMKPDWKDAPEWANWLAKDRSGWWWFDEEPGNHDGDLWYNEGDKATRADIGQPLGPKEPRPKKDPTVQVLIEKGTGAWEVIINGKLVASGRV